MSLTVPAHEHGYVRVFALSMANAEAEALRDNISADDDCPSPQRLALGATYIDEDFTEVFPLSDISELRLTGYLETGNGIDPDQLAKDKAKLEALEGWIFLVYSSAFGGFEQTLKPTPELTLIGTYSEPGVDWSDAQVLTSKAATEPAPTKPGPSDAAMSGRIATLVLVVLFTLTAVMIWVAA